MLFSRIFSFLADIYERNSSILNDAPDVDNFNDYDNYTESVKRRPYDVHEL